MPQPQGQQLQGLLTRSDFASLDIPVAKLCAWIAEGWIEQIGTAPTEDGSLGEPVYTIVSRRLREELLPRLEELGRAEAAASPIRARSQLLRLMLARKGILLPFDSDVSSFKTKLIEDLAVGLLGPDLAQALESVAGELGEEGAAEVGDTAKAVEEQDEEELWLDTEDLLEEFSAWDEDAGSADQDAAARGTPAEGAGRGDQAAAGGTAQVASPAEGETASAEDDADGGRESPQPDETLDQEPDEAGEPSEAAARESRDGGEPPSAGASAEPSEAQEPTPAAARGTPAEGAGGGDQAAAGGTAQVASPAEGETASAEDDADGGREPARGSYEVTEDECATLLGLPNGADPRKEENPVAEGNEEEALFDAFRSARSQTRRRRDPVDIDPLVRELQQIRLMLAESLANKGLSERLAASLEKIDAAIREAAGALPRTDLHPLTEKLEELNAHIATLSDRRGRQSGLEQLASSIGGGIPKLALLGKEMAASLQGIGTAIYETRIDAAREAEQSAGAPGGRGTSGLLRLVAMLVLMAGWAGILYFKLEDPRIAVGALFVATAVGTTLFALKGD
ncbi:MAG: hypothetical protein Fur0037_00030 [Planctomycetota bacterium]